MLSEEAFPSDSDAEILEKGLAGLVPRAVDMETVSFPMTGNQISYWAEPKRGFVLFTYTGPHAPQLFEWENVDHAWAHFRLVWYNLTQREAQAVAADLSSKGV